MRYSFEYKKKCVELYRQGIWVETPDGFTDPRNFHSMIRKWNRIAENCGIEKLKHEKNKKWSQQEKNELILQILRGNSILEVASRTVLSTRLLQSRFLTSTSQFLLNSLALTLQSSTHATLTLAHASGRRRLRILQLVSSRTSTSSLETTLARLS